MSSSNALESLAAIYSDSENEDDIMDGLLPLETKKLPCLYPKGLQLKLKNRVSYLHSLIQNTGLNTNEEIQRKKNFSNPQFYEQMIAQCNLNESGTNYPPEKYNPNQWGKESYYDQLAKVQNEAMEELAEKERKRKTEVEIVSGPAKKSRLTKGSRFSSIST